MTYTFPDHINNDTFEGAEFTMSLNAAPMNISNTNIRMQLRKSYNSDVVFDLDSADSEIIITNGTAGLFRIPKQVIGVPLPGVYQHDIQFTFPNGDVKTYISGTWKITGDITRP